MSTRTAIADGCLGPRPKIELDHYLPHDPEERLRVRAVQEHCYPTGRGFVAVEIPDTRRRQGSGERVLDGIKSLTRTFGPRRPRGEVNQHGLDLAGMILLLLLGRSGRGLLTRFIPCRQAPWHAIGI